MLLPALLVPSVSGAQSAEPQEPQGTAAPVAPQGQLPLEAFASLPFVEAPSLSPDGQKIAAKFAIDGEQVLAIISTVDGEQKITRSGLRDNDLNWWDWVNDDWLILGLGAELPVQGNPWYVTRVVSMRADGGVIKQLGWREAAQSADDVIWVARDGSPRIQLALQTSIYIDQPGFWPKVDEYDVSTGKARHVVRSKRYVRGWYADAAGTVRMGIGYSDPSRRADLYYRADDDANFERIATARSREDEELTAPALFLADPLKALAFDDSSGFTELRMLTMPSLDLGETVFAVPGYDIGSIRTDITGEVLAGIGYVDTRRRIHWVDPEMAALQAQLDKAVGPDRQASIVSHDRARDKFIIAVGGADRPSIYYSFEPQVGAMLLLARSNTQLPSGALAPVTSIRYPARDGLEIEAVLTLPKGRAAKDLPLILLPHGGPFARDLEEWDWMTQFLANRGYAVIQPNYRGSSGYGAAFAAKGEGQWGLAMQDDLNDAVDHLVKQGIADPDRVCIVGGSYGGYAAMRGAQRDGSRYRCAISYAGVSDLGSMVRYDSRFLNRGARKDWMKDQAPDFKSVSPVNFAAQFSTPILLMHGRLDRRVQVKQSREMAEKLEEAGKVFRYVEQPLGDHHFSREEDRVQFLKEMEAFLYRYNPS